MYILRLISTYLSYSYVAADVTGLTSVKLAAL